MHQFGHIGVYVKDLEVSKTFYTEILGCTVLKEYDYPDSHLVFLDAGGTVIELISKESVSHRPVRGAIDHMAFKVDSLDEVMILLHNRNIPIIGEPRIVGSARIVFIEGPNNERFEFTEHIQ
ncbi:MAG: hypothetical protein AVO33_06110 [delta proteobacterium ML8_F1]|nr:MAG: hypothetical protein AVO33_06110 [delta proteobacterium ML8_F1]